jgi:hypothetical protein
VPRGIFEALRGSLSMLGGERAAIIAGEILRAAGIPEKDEATPKRARGRPPGSKNKPKDAGRRARNQ